MAEGVGRKSFGLAGGTLYSSLSTLFAYTDASSSHQRRGAEELPIITRGYTDNGTAVSFAELWFIAHRLLHIAQKTITDYDYR